MVKKILVFDLDGTIADSEKLYVDIIAKSLLASSDFEINELIKEGSLVEVKNE